MSASVHSKLLGFGLIVVSAVSFGFMPIFATFSYQNGLDVQTILLFRFLIAAILLNLYLWWRGYRYPRGKALITLIFMGAVLYAIQAFSYFTAVGLIGSSLTSILLYTHPAIVLVLSMFLLKTRIKRTDIVALTLTTIGAILVIGLRFGDIDIIGVFFGLTAAVVYSLYILIGTKVMQRIDPLVASTVIISSAALIYLVYGVSIQLAIPSEPIQWLLLMGVALISTIVAISTFFYGLKIIGPVKASMVSTLELITTLIFAFILLGEQIGMMQIMGSLLILFAALLLAQSKG
jgi:drug/metabolite transporter (DMT)-like permease